MRRRRRCATPRTAALAGALALGACQGGGGPLTLEAEADSPVAALQTINEAGQECWFRSGERRFGDLALVPELDTQAGRPRLLVVRSGRRQSPPVLVVEAAGRPVTIETYGPLANTATGARINRDIRRWMAGPDSCND